MEFAVCIASRQVPTAYISYEVAEKILFIGKGVKLLNEFRKMINRNRDRQASTEHFAGWN